MSAWNAVWLCLAIGIALRLVASWVSGAAGGFYFTRQSSLTEWCLFLGNVALFVAFVAFLIAVLK